MCTFQSLDTLDNGKTFKDAVNDVKNAISVARYFAGLADKVVGQTIPSGNSDLVQLAFFLLFSELGFG